MNPRPSIPSDIKRKVRQRCGFGCVICGLPLYEYEHMLEWSKVKRHVAKEITLLCREHHGQKTNGLLPVAKVIKADKKPYNLKHGVSKKLSLHYYGDRNISFSFGESIITCSKMSDGDQLIPIVIDDIPIISFVKKDDTLLLNFIAFNKSNEAVFQITENEAIYSVDHWDVEWIKNRLTIREKKGDILLSIEFNPPNEIKIINATILCNGIEIHLRKNYIACLNNQTFFGKVHAEISPPSLGFIFGRRSNHHPCVGYHANISRYGIDREKSLKWLRKSVKKLKS